MDKLFDAKKIFLAPKKKVQLDQLATEFNVPFDKEGSLVYLDELKSELIALQEVLMAEKKHSVWLVLQAMDAAGKDSTIEHVFSGLNPQGFDIHSFKAPSAEEYAHDFLWRHANAVPEKGKIGIHNRSHYEFLTTCKVHPNYVLAENLPYINSLNDVNEGFWKKRFSSVKNFEQHLAANGVTIIKIFLHISKEEQKVRFLARINEEDKNWKFNPNDLKERALWDDYMKCFEQVFEQTSSKDAPWYLIPADKKWFARVAIAQIVRDHLRSLKMSFPTLAEEEKEQLAQSKLALEKES